MVNEMDMLIRKVKTLEERIETLERLQIKQEGETQHDKGQIMKIWAQLAEFRPPYVACDPKPRAPE